MFLNENNDKRRLLRMSDKTFVSAQQFLFNSLWSIALPYKEKIKKFEYDKKNPLQRMFPSHMKYAISLENLSRRQ
jgi:hypothetical protein